MKQNRLLPFQGPRLVFFSVIMLCTLVVMVLRLYDYQFVEHDRFVAAADENAIQSVPLPAPRGVILDRYNVALALNSPAWLVSVTPAYLPDDDKAALDVLNRLSALINVPPTRAAADAAGKRNVRSLEELVNEGAGIAPYRPVVVKTDVEQSNAQQILENLQNLPGVSVDWGAVRQYPNGPTTAQLVGYLGPIGPKEADELRKQGYNPSFERTGYAGVEASMNDELSGVRGRRVQKIDVAGKVVEGGLISEQPAEAGVNVKLTLDLALQRGAQAALNYQIDKINIEEKKVWTESGVVISMNPQTGEVLAMVSLPTYDNAKFARFIDSNYYLQISKEAQIPLVNHAISITYPPGSTWKILTAIAVANEKVIDPDANLYDPGSLEVQNSFAPNDVSPTSQRFVCWDRQGHKDVNLIKALAVSCDVYFYQVGGGNPDVSPQTLRPGGLGITNLDRYAAAFGVGEPTMIELPAAQAGNMPDPDWKRRTLGESWSTGDTYNAAFGQGYVIVTPLQLANVAAAIANGGTLYHPTIINSLVDSQNNTLTPFKKQVMRTLVLPKEGGSQDIPAGADAVLMYSEDMRVQGKNSLSCTCERDSIYSLNAPIDSSLPADQQDAQRKAQEQLRALYGKQIQDPSKPDDPTAKIWICDPAKVMANYRPTIMVDRDVTPPATSKVNAGTSAERTVTSKPVRFESITYSVFVPYDYTFRDGVCNEDVFSRTVSKLTPDKYKLSVLADNDLDDMGYQPPFVDPQAFKLVQEGMRRATKTNEATSQGYTGTAAAQNSLFGYVLNTYSSGAVDTSGKTGTAEYCDKEAKDENLCKPGNWPAHAWFIGYAPSDKPEIVTVGFVYHGNEGSSNALPIVRKVTDCYFRLKDARAKGQTVECKASDDPASKTDLR